MEKCAHTNTKFEELNCCAQAHDIIKKQNDASKFSKNKENIYK